MTEALRTYCLVCFYRKNGKICKTLDGEASSMLEFWALQNTSKTQDSILFESATGNVIAYFEGTDSGMPQVSKKDVGNIEDYCPGLLEAIKEAN